MAEAPQVTAITIFYQAERFLEEAIESVLGQTYSSWELLLVDDGSTDGGTEIARRYAEAHPERIRYLEHDEHRNLGMSAARNLGVRAANGTYVAFLDADDLWLPKKLEDQVAIMEAHPEAVMLYGRTCYWYGWTGQPADVARDRLSDLPAAPDTLVPPPALLLAMLRNEANVPSTCGVLISRAAIEDIGGFDPDFRDMYEDMVLYAKIFKSHPVYVSSGCWDRYRQHDGNSCAVAAREGLWDPAGPNPSRRRYLQWMERYLTQEGAPGHHVWDTLQRELSAYRSRPMSVVEAREVIVAPPDPRLVGRAIDRPRTGDRSDGTSIDLMGWVLGKSSRAVALELLHEDRVVQRMTLEHRRPDLLKAFPDVPHADQSGFRTQLQTLSMGEGELDLRAVLADQDRVPLAKLRLARRWREDAYHAAAPLVSVVIPCYDQARFLHEAIESVLAQTYPHLELVVVDDGSHDNTSEVAGRYPGVKLVRQDNAGLSAARNTGLRQTSGAYLIFLDADDRLLPDAVAAGLGAFAEHPEAAFVAGRHRIIDSDGVATAELPMPALGADAYEGFLQSNVIGMHATVMYQRIALQAIGDFDTSLDACEDYDLYLRVTRQMPVAAHDGLVAEYRRHSASITRDAGRMRRAALRVLDRQWPLIEDNLPLIAAHDEGRRFWLRHYPAKPTSSASVLLSAGRASGRATSWSGADSSSPGRVLMYHRISEPGRDPWGLAVSPDHFEEHLEVLRREHQVMTLSDATRALETGPLPAGTVLVTFDDGYADNLVAALPALERHDVPGVIFVATGYLDRAHGFWWDELERLLFAASSLPEVLHLDVRGTSFRMELPPIRDDDPGSASEWRALEGQANTSRQILYERLWSWMQPLLDAERQEALEKVAAWMGASRTPAGPERSLSSAEVAQMAQHALLELGAHTVTHPRLAALTTSMQRLEIRGSARSLEAITGRPVIAMAYPFGGENDVDGDSVRAAAEVGYRAAFMAVPGPLGEGHDRLRVPRHYIPDWDGEEFTRWLRGATTPQEAHAPLVGASVR